MRRRSFILGLLMVVLGFASQAQIYKVYEQGFEVGEPRTYTLNSGTVEAQTELSAGGQKALKMVHEMNMSTVITLDTIDMSSYASLSYYTLEFAHINNASPFNFASTEQTAMIEVKLPSSNTWTRLTSTYYDMSEDHSTYFEGTGYFSSQAYGEWMDGTMNNTCWKHERFILNRLFSNVAAPMRKLEVRLTLFPKTGNVVAGDQAWWIDDIVVKASPQPIIKPIIHMLKYPDLVNYPNSRGAKIEISAKAGTGLTLNQDSIYILYRVGSNPTIHKHTMQPIVGTDRYSFHIPFEGYDTMMYFRVVVKDASTNENARTRPESADAWFEYKCIRGYGNTGFIKDIENSRGGTTTFPFPSNATAKTESIVDSAWLAEAGFKPGAITGLDFLIVNGLQSGAQTRQDMQIRMKNVYNSHRTSEEWKYTDDYIQTVYAGDINFPIVFDNNTFHLDLQDTFYYAGSDLIVQIIQHCNDNLPRMISVGDITLPESSTKKTLWTSDDAYMGYNPYTAAEYKVAMNQANSLPNYSFTMHSNPPLLVDAGVTEITHPASDNAAQAGVAESVIVTFANLGVSTINAAKITYQLDDETPVTYNWTGTLASGATTSVTLTTNESFAAGYHTMKAWVEDTLTIGTSQYRDHEPYNDTSFVEFISCDGPLSGVRQIGGTNAHFNTIEEFMFALSSCGINGQLTVKIAGGTYGPITMSAFDGGSVTNYVQFEPLNVNDSVIFLNANGTQQSLVDLQNVSHVRFKNIFFKQDSDVDSPNYLVQLGANSQDCHFINCQFLNEQPSNGEPLALLQSGGASQFVVEGCTFKRGIKSIDLTGTSPTAAAANNKIKGSIFIEPREYAVYAQYQNNVEIDSNYVENVVVNSGYAILLQNITGASKVTRNKIYTSHGSAAIGVAGMTGSASAYGIVANNMIVENDNGVAISIVPPLNVQSASYVKFVYNSVQMNAPTRSGAAAAAMGGILLENCYIQNNAFVTIDNTNFALIYNPRTATSNVIGNNIYYTEGSNLNRYNTTTCADLVAWQTAVPSDVSSANVNPGFLNGSLVDLRTYSQTIKNIATPISEVTIDMFGSTRHATNPCVGAFEFDVLNYDFEIVGVDEPFNEYCGVPGAVPLNVKIRNWGSSNYTTAAGDLKLHYAYTTDLGVAQSGVATISQTLNAGTTTDIATGETLTFPLSKRHDYNYAVKLWVETTLDPNNTNDTIIYNVLVKYVSPAMSTITSTVSYNTPATLTPSTDDGLEVWRTTTYTETNAKKPSTVYWFESATSEDTLFRGNTFVTDNLLTDTVFYINQHRELSLMRISEVMMDNAVDAAGQMPVRPIWMNANTKVAIELTNVGDYPADLEGDTLMITSNESAYRNKIFKFPQSLIIQPGASVVVQFRTGVNTPDSTITLSSNINITSSPVTKSIAVVYYHDGEIVDAIATNDMVEKTQWTALNVPSAVWSGVGLDVTAGTAGIKRTSWPSEGTASGSVANNWISANQQNMLTMGQTNPDLILYTNNGCSSPRSEVRVNLINIPAIDLAVDLQPMEEGCGLGDEAISAVVHNYGIQDCASATVHYSVGGVLMGTESVSNLTANSSQVVNFTTLVNMHLPQDSLFSIQAWVEKNASEYSTMNDTSRLEVMSKRTPDAPVVAPVGVAYATAATLQPTDIVNDSLIWYDKDLNVLDTANVYITEPIYAEDTFYVNAIVPNVSVAELSEGTSQTTANDKSSPYASYYKQYKAQYIYTVEDLVAAGLTPGSISSISFYVSDVSSDVSFSDYSIMMGATNEDYFRSTSAWESPEYLVYSSDNFSFSAADEGSWLTHTLTTPYIWDGQSNIVIQICRSLSSANRKTVKTRYKTETNTTLAFANDNNSSQCESTNNGLRGSKRPHIKFGLVDYGCTGPMTEIPIALSGVPNVDGFVKWDSEIDNAIYSSCDDISLPIVVRSMGRDTVHSYSIEYFVDDQSVQTLQQNVNLSLGDVDSVSLPAYAFTPGRHKIKVILTVANDDIHSNDTIERTIPIRFCGGTYTVGEGMNYSDISSALDTLNAVGMEGSVIFNIASGTYLGQAEFGVINGAAADRTITFQSMTGNAEDVILKTYPTNTNNYVVNINGSQYLTLRNLSIYSDFVSGSGNNIFASAMSLSNCSHITIDSCNIKVRNTASVSVNSDGIIINDGVTNLVVSNSNIDSSNCAIVSNLNVEGSSHHITINDNNIQGFYSRGISVREINDLTILHNTIKSSALSNNRALQGVYVNGHTGALSIERNNIVLADNFTGGKRGIVLTEIEGALTSRGRVINNMISLTGTGVAGLLSHGISIDSTTSYINVYYNTIRLATGSNATTTRALSIGDRMTNCTNINVRDNVLSNFSKGYAYYVKVAASVTSSDYNAIFTNAEAPRLKFAYWGGDDYNTLAELQAVSHLDAHSIVDEPAFVSEEDLHLAIGQYSALADYNADVVEDIDGRPRPQIPSPTIGAHEFNRPTRDVAIVAVLEPVMPLNIHDHPNVEGRPIRVVAKIFNNGTVVERNITWYAELVGYNLQSATRTIATLSPREYYYDTAFITPVLGIIDTHQVTLHLTSTDDSDLNNNTATVNVFLDPAYNIQVVNVSATGGCEPVNSESVVTMLIKNVGLDTITTTMPLNFGYTAFDSRGSTALNNTLPVNVSETQFLSAILPPNTTRTITMNTPADLYPHGIDSNFFALRIKGWVHYQYDLHPENDTATSANIQSFYTPLPPVGVDLTIPYATWDTVWASQRNNHVVEWYRDSNDANTRFNVSNNYERSCHWDNTPQYFHDSTYYLLTRSTKGCRSHFSEVHVRVNPLVPFDVAVQDVIKPFTLINSSRGHVYNEKDTVVVRIINYGSQSVSNIPVTYSFSRSTDLDNPIQVVTETCTATIAPGQTYDYQFDSLLNIPTPVSYAQYAVRTWTDLQTDQVRLNDTLRSDYIFRTSLESDYGSPNVSSEGFDITRVTFNTLHNELLPLGYKYQNFGLYANPEIAPLHVIHGTTDTLYVRCQNNQDVSDNTSEVKLGVWMDYNRDGQFRDKNGDANMNECLYKQLVRVGDLVKIPVTIPDSAHYGYTRMRINISTIDASVLDVIPAGVMKIENDQAIYINEIDNGHSQDYLIFVDEVAPTIDASLTRIQTPYYHVVDSIEYHIQVAMANNGAGDISNAAIHCTYEGPEGITDTTYQWTGNLESGHSTIVTLPGYRFAEGTTNFTAIVNVAGDINPTYDTLRYEYHRFHIITLPMMDSFELADIWYAPQGATPYTRNVWELGTPNKSLLNHAYSGDSAWVTDLTNAISTGKYGNRSELYTPIIDISQVRPNEMLFFLSKYLTNDSYLRVEYFNYDQKWVSVQLLEPLEDGSTLSSWYDDEDKGFSGNTGGTYISRTFPLRKISSDFPQRLQFRFVFTTPPSTDNAFFGEGCAIDDFSIGRAPRPADLGVTDIIYPTEPRYGETIYPTVVIKNYGTVEQHIVDLAYRTYGSNLSKIGRWTGNVAPGDTVHYTFTNPFIVASDFPDSFDIQAYTTVSADMYWDNDTVVKRFGLSPLEYDLNMEGFVSPLDRVVAGDSLDITVRMRNFGTEPITTARLSYIFNHGEVVTEDVDFVAMCGGEGLGSMEFFNYTFKKRVRASLGYMAITAYGKYDDDIYIYNDTIDKRIEGITSISDLVASAVVVDTSVHQYVSILLMIDNQGSRALNDFEVGFWYDNDTNTMVRRTFHRDEPLASLATTSYLFKHDSLPDRSAPYSHVCGFVHAVGDNDRSNDTTCNIVEQFIDIKALRLEVEENRDSNCAVRLVVENIGNQTVTRAPKIKATINGVELKTTVDQMLIPGRIYHLMFDDKLPKSATRSYVGSGSVRHGRDVNEDNNQTSIVKVLNYFEDIPLADDNSKVILEQNYPNPFTNTTAIEFVIPEGGEVVFYVVDVMGRIVYQSTDFYNMGRNTINYNANSLSSGTYYYGIIYNGKRATRKMIIK